MLRGGVLRRMVRGSRGLGIGCEGVGVDGEVRVLELEGEGFASLYKTNSELLI